MQMIVVIIIIIIITVHPALEVREEPNKPKKTKARWDQKKVHVQYQFVKSLYLPKHVDSKIYIYIYIYIYMTIDLTFCFSLSLNSNDDVNNVEDDDHHRYYHQIESQGYIEKRKQMRYARTCMRA